MGQFTTMSSRIDWSRTRNGAVQAIGWVLLTLACVLVGVMVTATWPTTVQTADYQATVRLSPSPSNVGVLHAPTLFGDLDLRFSHPLPTPGIEVDGQLRTSFTKLLLAPNPSIASLRPSEAELDAAITTAAWQVALKFSLGALAAAVLALISVHAVKRARGIPHSWRRSAIVPGVAALTALTLTGVGSWATYQPGKLQTINTTGLISVLRANAGLMSSVQSRATEATPYVKNVLAISAALQQKYAAGGSFGAVAPLKLLLVSDIHGANQYPLMKSIVESEGITAVIDSGDIVNFGRPDELSLAGISAGIASLGVPYLFVTGNHDASARHDEAIVDAIKAIPNAIVLQPSASEYTLADVGGLRIAGFNDPRWFGDGGHNTAAAQVPARKTFQRALDALDSGSLGPGAGVDIVVAHEPAAVETITGTSLRINGHLHKDTLDGNRIGVGTFTGGGIASHYIEESDGELAGQPYAFDILAFTTGCDLSTLTRYQFRNIVEGRPVYDDVRVINGQAIQSPAPSGPRVCGPTVRTTTTSFAPPAASSHATSTTSATPSTTSTATQSP